MRQKSSTVTKKALQTLFSTASRAKRSKIKSFIPVVEALGGYLKFPTELGERFGLQLSKALLNDPYAPRRMTSALQVKSPSTVDAEHEVIKHCLETENAPMKLKVKTAAARSITPIEGITMSTTGRSITRHGRRVDPRLYADLQIWLKGRS